MVKGKKIKPEYIIGIIIPIVIVGLIIFAVNRGNDTSQFSNLKDYRYENDTKENNDNLLSKTSSTENGILNKAISNQIIGEWIQSNNSLLIIYKTDDKYLLGEVNSDGGKKNYELVEKYIRGNQAFIIKELLEGTIDSNNVKLINDYTDYYLIGQDGDLALYDKEGLIEKYKRVSNSSSYNETQENNKEMLRHPSLIYDNNSPKSTSAEIGLLNNDTSTQIIGQWDQSNNSIVMIYIKHEKYFMMEVNRKGYGVGHELIAKKIRGNQAFIVKELFEGTNVPSDVKFINDYTDYYLIDQNGDLALYDKEGLIEKYRKID